MNTQRKHPASQRAQPPTKLEIGAWQRRLTSGAAAAIVLLGFYLLLLGSVREKSATADELGHVVSGYSYWRFDDYRLDPENGNLPQRWVALPLALGHTQFPPLDSAAWRESDQFHLGYEWFYRLGNDADAMLLKSRAMAACFAVALGALVWLWARQLFGPLGGMLSLLLCVLNPTLLANGALTTSDTACALFFLASTWSIWAVLHRMTLGRVLTSAVVLGGLFVAKMSAPLIVPIALILIAARLGANEPLPLAWGKKVWQLTRRRDQALAFLLAAAAHALVVVAVVWAFFGFRYATFAQAEPARDHLSNTWESVLGRPPPLELLAEVGLTPEQKIKALDLFRDHHAQPTDWSFDSIRALQDIEQHVLTPAQTQRLAEIVASPPPSLMGRTLATFRRLELLPEAYIFGLATVASASDHRPAFLNGEYSRYGWKQFFPYTFLVKTPLPMFAAMILASAAAIASWRASSPSNPSRRAVWRQSGYRTLPLWALQAYWILPIFSHMNIGHRHIMPIYPPLFILCGAGAYWLGCGEATMARGRSRRFGAIAIGVVGIALAGEMLCRFPNYLTYFNGLVSPRHAYRHLVDSSLDWGQDLRALNRYIEKNHPARPNYLSYFGGASPAYYNMPVRLLPGNPDYDAPPPLLTLDLPAENPDAALADKLAHTPMYECIGMTKDGSGKTAAILRQKRAAFYWTGGTYFISATMLQTVGNGIEGADPFGPWNQEYEDNYRALAARIAPLFSPDPAVAAAAFAKSNVGEWTYILQCFNAYRLGRLTAYLRQREPDNNVNFSILVYRLTDEDVARALDGPPPELKNARISSTPRARRLLAVSSPICRKPL